MISKQDVAHTGASGAQIDMLELRASEQRRELHDSISDLRSSVREKLDVKKNLRPYVFPAAGIAVLLGVAFGYGATGVFKD